MNMNILYVYVFRSELNYIYKYVHGTGYFDNKYVWLLDRFYNLQDQL